MSNPRFCPKGQYRLDARSVVLRRLDYFTSVARAGVSMAIHHWGAIVKERSFARENRSCSDLVEKAEKLALAEIDEPLQISAVCRALAVSQRTLRKAFRATYGLPPCRRLRLLRLSEARRVLLAADCRRVTVTQIATGFGFLELGRFSVEYRKLFGETPSQTLRRQSQIKPVSPSTSVSHSILGAPSHRLGRDCFSSGSKHSPTTPEQGSRLPNNHAIAL
jgi:AraC-like DNA-binding protein